MTLAPLIHPSIMGIQGTPGALSVRCAAPDCTERAQQRHHLWPRSFLRGQPVEWVSVQGLTLQNTVGLCTHHHALVTGTKGHLAHIRWNEELKLLEWWVNEPRYGEDHWVLRGPLRGQTLTEPTPEPARAQAGEAEVCEGCGRPKRRARPSLPPGERRKTTSWGITVPADGEWGAEVLDTYIEDFGLLMGYHDLTPRLLRYHVLVPVLEWVSQNRLEFLRDWQEAADG